MIKHFLICKIYYYFYFDKMVNLSNNNYISEGEIRACYEHPEDRNLCIKIPKPEVSREYTYKEILYYKKINKRRRSNGKYLFYSNFIGEIETNLGLGQMFDLVRDETTGKISKTLEYYLNKDTFLTDSQLDKALLHLKKQMIDHKIFARDLRARNICCKLKRDNIIELVIIDGIGHRDFFPFADYSTFFARKKIERTFEKWHFTSIESQRSFLECNNNP